jgi:quaternary ammonium compound-resistance protein SugE
MLLLVWGTLDNGMSPFWQPHAGVAWPSAIGLAATVMSFVMLSVALKSLPVGSSVTVTGMIALGEDVSAALRLAFLALILAGISGLEIPEA